MEDKQCRKCGESKPLEAFYVDRVAKDGHKSSCIECEKARKRTPEVRAQSHRYYHSEKGKAAEYRYYHDGNGRAARKAYAERPERQEKRRESSYKGGIKYRNSPHGQAALQAMRADPGFKARKAEYRLEYLQRPGVAARNREAIKRWQAIHGTAQSRKYRAEHRERTREVGRQRERARRNLKAQLPASFTLDQWQAAIAWWQNACVYCGSSDMSLTQDHFVPLRAGGPYTAHNIVPACFSCNCRKQGKMPEAFCPPATLERIHSYFKSLDGDKK